MNTRLFELKSCAKRNNLLDGLKWEELFSIIATNSTIKKRDKIFKTVPFWKESTIFVTTSIHICSCCFPKRYPNNNLTFTFLKENFKLIELGSSGLERFVGRTN